MIQQNNAFSKEYHIVLKKTDITDTQWKVEALVRNKIGTGLETIFRSQFQTKMKIYFL